MLEKLKAKIEAFNVTLDTMGIYRPLVTYMADGGTVLGALILTLIGNILNLTDAVSNYLNGAVQGIIVIVAVYLQRGAWRRD